MAEPTLEQLAAEVATAADRLGDARTEEKDARDVYDEARRETTSRVNALAAARKALDAALEEVEKGATR